MLSAIKIDFEFIDEDKKTEYFKTAFLRQSGLIIWWLINFIVINALGPNFSIELILMEVIYALLMIWLFAVITFKAINYKEFSVILNPLVLIIGIVALIICSIAIIVMFPWMKFWCPRLLSCLKNSLTKVRHIDNNPNESGDQSILSSEHASINQSSGPIKWVCLDPVFDSDLTPAVLPWGHVFHFECINYWVRSRGNATCPYDRTKVLWHQINRI